MHQAAHSPTTLAINGDPLAGPDFPAPKLVTRLDPALLPDQYAMTCVGACLESEVAGGADASADLFATALPDDPARAATLLRRELGALVTRALALLDDLDGDPDLEDGADDEDGNDLEAVNEDGGDIQDEPHDEEPDREPSLGALERLADQTRWAAGSVSDAEGDPAEDGIADHDALNLYYQEAAGTYDRDRREQARLAGQEARRQLDAKLGKGARVGDNLRLLPMGHPWSGTRHGILTTS